MGGSTIPGEYILPNIIGKFNQSYPHITVNLAIGDSSSIEKQVLAGELELGVIGSESSQPNLRCRKLWQDELVLAIPSTHPWAKRMQISPEEMLAESFILREEGSGTLKMLDAYLQALGTLGVDALKVIARFGSSTAVKEGVKSSLGLSILSARAIETDVNAGLITALRIKGLSMSRYFFLIRNKQRIASPACQALLDFLVSGNPR